MRLIDRVARGLAARGARAAWGTLPGGEIAEALARAGIRYLPVRSAPAAGRAAATTARLGGFPGIAVVAEGEARALGASLDPAGRELVVALIAGADRGAMPGAVLEVESLERQLLAAFRTGRGPVALAVRAEVGRHDVAEPMVVYEAPISGVPDLAPVAARVSAWARPLIAVGAAGRRAPVGRLAEALHAPVATSAGARGVVPEHTGWSLDVAARAGAIDGILCVGLEPDEMPDLPAVDRVWLDEPGSALPSGGAVAWGPLPGLVAALAERVAPSGRSQADLEVLRPPADDRGPVAAAAVALRALIGGGDVAVIDAGTRSPAIAAAWRCDRPDRLIEADGWGGAAALAVAESGRRAVLVVDPPAFDRAWPEVVAASEADLPFLVAVVADEPSLGDPVGAVRSLGGFARRVGSAADLAAAFRDAVADESGRVAAISLELPWGASEAGAAPAT